MGSLIKVTASYNNVKVILREVTNKANSKLHRWL